MLIDHIGLGVSDYERGKRFYGQVLGALGAALLTELTPEQNPNGWACGFGRNGRPDFWIGSEGRTTPKMHIAFTARSREEVRDFHRLALHEGARDNGQPGLRPHYHPNYYAAFVLDADEHNIEAVCHAPE